MNFTFKKDRPTGSYASFQNDYTAVKFNKKSVGFISETRHENLPYSIGLYVEKKDIMEDNNPNCTWKTVIFKQKFKSEKDARTWLKENKDDIFSQYTLRAVD